MRVHQSLALLGLSLVLGCGHARVIRRTQAGGVLTLEGDRHKAMEDAHRQMSMHCQGPYTIEEEGEEVVGTDTVHGEETYVAEDGTLVSEHGTSTRDATEWRIRYVCGRPGPAQPGTAPPAAPEHAPPGPDQPPPPPPPGG